MKKLLVVLGLVIVIGVIGIYVLIPSTVNVHTTLVARANREGLMRRMENTEKWMEWWPGKSLSPGQFECEGVRYQAGPAKNLSLPMDLHTPYWNAHTELTLIALDTGSTTLDLETAVTMPMNPVDRLKAYFSAQKLDRGFATILQSISRVYSRIPVLYDYDIRKEKVVDSILVFTSKETKGYPSINQVYALVDELRAYIRQNGAKETGYPMQNIYTRDSIDYLVRVAIPVSKRLPDTDKFRYKWMLGGGNILITEVKGGQAEISKAYIQIHNYVSDYQRIAPAISFESLVVDRRQQPDSAQWITKIYYPVM